MLRRAAAAALAAGLLCLAGAALADPAPKPRPPEIERATAEPALVRMQGDTLYYTGNLSKASSAAFDAAVAGVSRGRLTRLVIGSGGGDTVEGRHIGRWVRDMALVVEVDVICFSSCADYVFPAGRARVIRADASAVCAVGDVLEKRPGYAGQMGWGFSLADMARLGLTHTVYLGEGRYERDSSRFRQNLVLLGADECLALLK
jgi:hypothetical protein